MRTWDVGGGALRCVLNGHSAWVRSLAVAPDGTWLASGDDDGTTRIWDLVRGRARHVLTGHAGAVRAISVASDGIWLATSSTDGTVRTWAEQLGLRDAVTLLQQTLDEEKATDRKLTTLAESRVNLRAAS